MSESATAAAAAADMNHMNDLVDNSSGKKSCSKFRKGLWSPEEDEKLMNYMLRNGQGCWSDIARNAELQRCGKSCRLRWINYLRPDLKRGAFSPHEEDLILRLHSVLGNRWSQIAARLPGRTDNEIKNFWNSTIKKRLQNNNNLESISTSPDGSIITSFDAGFMTMCTELSPFNFPFDSNSRSENCYTDYNGACSDNLSNMKHIYSDQIDLVTDRFNVDKWITDDDNMEFIQETEENIKDVKSVTYTDRNAARKDRNGVDKSSIYGEQLSVGSLKIGEMWDMEGLMDYSSCSSASFHCENLPRSQ